MNEKNIKANRKGMWKRLKRALALALMFALALSALPVNSVFANPARHQRNAVVGLEQQAVQFEQQMDYEASTVIGFIADQAEALEAITAFRAGSQGLVGFEGQYALAGDSSPVNVIVVFRSNPAGVQIAEAQMAGEILTASMAERNVESDHVLFRNELNALFRGTARDAVAPFTINHEYRVALNGVAMTLPANMVEAVAEFDSVFAIFPDTIVYFEPVDVELLINEAPEIMALAEGVRNPIGSAPGRARTNADTMHQMGYRGQGVLIAVIDSGIDYNHPAFLGSFPTIEQMHARGATHITTDDLLHIAGGYIYTVDGEQVYIPAGYFYVGRDFIHAPWTNANPASPMETRADHPGRPDGATMHGTHVSGIALARDTGGTMAVRGFAPEAQAIHFRFLAQSGIPNGGGVGSNGIAAMERAALDRVDIINNSWGGGTSPSAASSLAVNNIVLSHGIIFTNATGNAGSGFFGGGAPSTASRGISVGNFIESRATMMNFYGGGVEDAAVNLFQPFFHEFWAEYQDTGRFVPVLLPTITHTNGFLNIIPLPVSPGSPAGAGNENVAVGGGNAADFALLDEMFTPEELAGAFLLVRRGYGFADIGNQARARGMGGAISINTPAQDMIVLGMVGAYANFQFMMINHNDGVTLADYLYDSENTVGQFALQGFRDWIELAVWQNSSRGPVPETFEILPSLGTHGNAILSTVPWWTSGNTEGNHFHSYARAGGTSMSAPAIAGLAAIMLQYVGHTGNHNTPRMDERWNTNYWEVRARLMNTAFDVENLLAGVGQQPVASVFEQGAGQADVLAAVGVQNPVYVIFQRAATAPGVLDGTTKAGSFSFGQIPMGQSASLDFNPQGVAIENITFVPITAARMSGTGAEIAFSPSETTPGYFTATITLPNDDAQVSRFFEGFIHVGDLRLPYAAVGTPGITAELAPMDYIGIWRPVISGFVSPNHAGYDDPRMFPAGFLTNPGLFIMSARSNYSPVTFGFADPSDTPRDVRFYVGPYGSEIGDDDKLFHAQFNNVAANQNFFAGNLLRPIVGGQLFNITGQPNWQASDGFVLPQGLHTLTMFVANPGGEDLIVPFNFAVTTNRPTIVFDRNVFTFAPGASFVTITGRVISPGHDLAINSGLIGMSHWNGSINLTDANRTLFDYNQTYIWLEDLGTEFAVNPDGTFAFSFPVPANINGPISAALLAADGDGVSIIPNAVGGAWSSITWGASNLSLPTNFTIQVQDEGPDPDPDVVVVVENVPSADTINIFTKPVSNMLVSDFAFVVDGVDIVNIRPFTTNIVDDQERADVVKINKNMAWQTIAIWFDGEYVETITNDRFLSTTIFEEFWRESANIRFFRGVNPVEALSVSLDNITLTIDGEVIDNIRDYTLNIAGWQTETTAVFLNRNLTWQEAVLRVEIFGQVWEHTSLNSRFLSVTIFDEFWRESANIRFFQGVDPIEALTVSLDNITLTIDGEVVDNIRDYTLNIAGWQTETTAVFLNRNLPWQEAVLRVEVFGQVWERTFLNSRFFSVTIYDEFWRESANIRFFQGVDPIEALTVSLDNITLIVDGQVVNDIRDYTLNIAGWQTETTAVFLNRNLPWQEAVLRVEIFGQVWERTLLNSRFLTTTIYEEEWRESANIRFFQGVDPIEPLTVCLDNITLIIDGVAVSDIRPYTLNIAGWQTETTAVFLNRNLPWQEAILRVEIFGQVWERTFLNPRFLSTTIFEEDWRESINIRFFQGVAPAVPLTVSLSDITLMIDGQIVPDIRPFTINIADWQTETNAVFLSKLQTPWQQATIRVDVFGQVWERSFINNMFE